MRSSKHLRDMRHLTLALLLLTSVSNATATTSVRQVKAPAWGTAVRLESYRAVVATSFGGMRPAVDACAHMTDAVPVSTPNPTLNSGSRVTMDFVVGEDGRVYSAFVLESTDGSSSKATFAAMGTWRFRPATCNGVPTDSEARITFKR